MVGAGQETDGTKPQGTCTVAKGCPRGCYTGKGGSDTALCLSEGRLWARGRLELPMQKALGVWSVRRRGHLAGPCSPWPRRNRVTSRRHIVSTLNSACMLARCTLESGTWSSHPKRTASEIWPSLGLKAQLAEGRIMVFGCHGHFPGWLDGSKWCARCDQLSLLQHCPMARTANTTIYPNGSQCASLSQQE